MSSPYVGEIRMFAGNYAPVGWALCDGSLISISENPTLYQLIGTTYGGDGTSNYALPDLRGRVPVDVGPGFAWGQRAGEEQVTLTTPQIPSHNHLAQADGAASTQNGPSGAIWGKTTLNSYSKTAPSTGMNPQAIGATGGNQPHDNMLPYLAINYIIALFGVFPTQN